jgi:LPXTG-motif cell wall-anchored protein
MKRSRTAAAAIVLALALTAGAPAAASAYTPDPPAASCPQIGSAVVSPVGPSASIACALSFPVVDNIRNIIAFLNAQLFAYSSFAAFERVTFSLIGSGLGTFGPYGNLAVVRIGAVQTVSIAKVADAAGAVSVRLTLPADASGTYTLSAVGDVTGAVPDVTFTIPANADGTLPATGQDDVHAAAAWLGGGMLVLGGAMLALVTARRRRTA